MKRRYRFTWIDDDERKVNRYKDILESGYAGGISTAVIAFQSARGDLLSKIQGWSADDQLQPDLFIIDHIFNQRPPHIKGSSVAHLLRGKWPQVPMVCVTARFTTPSAFDQEDVSEYTAVFDYQRLDEHLDELYAIARDYPKIRIGGKDVRGQLVDLLKAPKVDRDGLKRIFPPEFRSQEHTTTQHRIASWVFNILMKQPGFLYDKLHAATLLGLTEKGFEKVSPLFEKAEYKGLFYTTKQPLWWVSQLQRILYAAAPDDAPDRPQLAGRMLPDVTVRDYSVCYVSKSPRNIPDVVARVDVRSMEKRQVCSRYTSPDPADVGVYPGFEGLFVISKSKKR